MTCCLFKLTERADRRDPVLRGTDGPIRVAPAAAGRHPVATAFADASVMPLIPNAHPHATVLAIAERAAALVISRPV
jgi:hypothetical protein